MTTADLSLYKWGMNPDLVQKQRPLSLPLPNRFHAPTAIAMTRWVEMYAPGVRLVEFAPHAPTSK